jgi:hypothetical protein
MDIEKPVNQIVQGIINEVLAQVQSAATSEISSKVDSIVSTIDCGHIMSTKIDNIVKAQVAQFVTKTSVDKLVTTVLKEVAVEVKNQTDAKIIADIAFKLGQIDFNQAFKLAIKSTLEDKLTEFIFPEKSIDASAIKTEDIKLSGNQIAGGIIDNFGSTGIEDKATQCIVTILDTDTIVENNLTTKDLTVKGNMIIDGSFVVNGDVPDGSEFLQKLIINVGNNVRNSLNEDIFTGFSNIVFNQIKEQGIDLNKITMNGEDAIVNNTIGLKITESNLQKVGLLRELQVQGETLIHDSFYVGNKRIGINTLEPSSALSVWDEEIEVSIGKRKKNVAVLQTPRGQDLILGSNNKDNITLSQDGATEIKALKLGTMKFTSSDVVPNYSADKGTVVFNSNPNMGGPMGWVCLGGANWGNFGIID